MRKALQELPRDEGLWKLAVSFETDKTQVVKMLEKATQFIPQSMDLLSIYTNLQSYHNAKMTLNSLRKILPQEPKIWIMAALLEERNNPDIAVDRLVSLLKNGLLELSKNGYKATLSTWLKRAEALGDTPNSNLTCQAIVYAVLELSLIHIFPPYSERHLGPDFTRVVLCGMLVNGTAYYNINGGQHLTAIIIATKI